METLSQWLSSLVELFWWSFDLLFHLDDELKKIVAQYGVWSHAILFAVIFCETGLIVTPFLPGDSLLFAAGAFAADRTLYIEWLLPLLMVAAVVGDTVNYAIGRWIGPRAFSGKLPFLKQAHLEKSQRFFDKYGGKTIILARFVPIIRTFAPFVAGIGAMNYRRFALYNVVGGIVWVLVFTLLGYYFGALSIVQKNFEMVMVAIVGISLLPPFWEWYQHRAKLKKPPVQGNTMKGDAVSLEAKQVWPVKSLVLFAIGGLLLVAAIVVNNDLNNRERRDSDLNQSVGNFGGSLTGQYEYKATKKEDRLPVYTLCGIGSMFILGSIVTFGSHQKKES